MSLRLVAILISLWDTLDGYAVAHNMPDLRELPLGRLCSFVWWHTTKDADEKGLEKFRSRLWMPPKGVAPDERSPWAPKNESRAFASLQSGLGIPAGKKPQGLAEGDATPHDGDAA